VSSEPGAGQTDRLIGFFNSGIHAHAAKQEIATALVDLIAWVYQLSTLDPKSFRQPYLAYTDELNSFLLEVFGDGERRHKSSG
jgi:hypothetical protein